MTGLELAPYIPWSLTAVCSARRFSRSQVTTKVQSSDCTNYFSDRLQYVRVRWKQMCAYATNLSSPT